MSTEVSPAAQVARESSREPSGRFGAQPAAESNTQLGVLDRDNLRSAAITVLADFDPCSPGRSDTSSFDLLRSHSMMSRGCSAGASATERARALTACIRGSLSDQGGLSPDDYDTIMCGVVPDRQQDALDLAATHREADEHLHHIRSGTALPGDHPRDSQVLADYRAYLDIREPSDTDATGQTNELALAWSFSLDRDALDLTRHTSRA